jgi:hypothetical protein
VGEATSRMEPFSTPEVWVSALKVLKHRLAVEQATHVRATGIQNLCDMLIAAHPDLVELDGQMDSLYDM